MDSVVRFGKSAAKGHERCSKRTFGVVSVYVQLSHVP